MMTQTGSSVSHGSSGLLLGYVCVALPLVVGMARGGAGLSRMVLAPLLAVPVMLVGAAVAAVVTALTGAVGISTESLLNTLLGLAALALLGYQAGKFSARRRSRRSGHQRGAVIDDWVPAGAAASLTGTGPVMPGEEHQSASAGREHQPLTVAGVPIPAEDETKHFKFIGTTGTGKSTAIRELLNAALRRGDRAVIADPDCGYMSNFFDAARGDIILNPFEADSVKWSVLAEIASDYDADQLARSLIPAHGEQDQSWSEHARAFFTAVVHQVVAIGNKDDAELYRLLTKAPLAELRILLKGTSAGPLLEEGNERMFGSVRSTASSAVRALQYTSRLPGIPFSVRSWVKSGAARSLSGSGGVLFMPYRAGEIAALRSAISAWMRIAIFEAMNQPAVDQRLWFVVDELDALGSIDGLKDALARLRKFGGRTVIGFQSIGQVAGTYGHAAADTIVENCGNTLILRCSASERGGTAEFASKLIGQRQVLHMSRSTSRRPYDWFASTTLSEQLRIEPAVMASEIERLADLEGFLKVASRPDWRRVRLTPVSYPKLH